MDYGGIKANYIAGTPYLGADVVMKPGPGGNQGMLIAWDIKNGKAAWTDPEPPWPVYSGVLSTAGDVVFYGTLDRMFKAVDAHTGKLLWQVPGGLRHYRQSDDVSGAGRKTVRGDLCGSWRLDGRAGIARHCPTTIQPRRWEWWAR